MTSSYVFEAPHWELSFKQWTYSTKKPKIMNSYKEPAQIPLNWKSSYPLIRLVQDDRPTHRNPSLVSGEILKNYIEICNVRLQSITVLEHCDSLRNEEPHPWSFSSQNKETIIYQERDRFSISKDTEWREFFKRERFQWRIVIHQVILVEPVRMLEGKQHPLERCKILFGGVQNEATKEEEEEEDKV